MNSRLRARLEELTEAMLAGFLPELRACGMFDERFHVGEIKELTRSHLALAFGVGEAAFLDEHAVGAFRELGRRCALRGIPLHAVLRAHQISTRVAWQFILEELAGMPIGRRTAERTATGLSVVFLGFISQITAAVSEAFFETQQDIAAMEERVRGDVLDELLEGSLSRGDAVRASLERMGYALGDAHAVAVLTVQRARETGGGQNEHGTWRQGLISALTAARPGTGASIVQARGDNVLVIFPVALGTSENRVRSALGAALRSLRTEDGGEVIGGLGRVEPGFAGIPASYRQALRVLDAARAIGVTGVCSYVEMAPYLLLLQDPSLAADLVGASVDLLASAPQGRQLVDTLEAFLEERGNLSATAKRLFVHRNTLAARLKRIRELTGRDLRDRRTRVVFELGLCAVDVLGSRTGTEAR